MDAALVVEPNKKKKKRTRKKADPSGPSDKKKRTRPKGDPARIFSYGAYPPTENLDLVVQQMKLAHEYRNALVRLELDRRARVEAALREIDPAILAADAEMEAARTAYGLACDEYREGNKRARERREAPDEKARLALLKSGLRAAEKKLAGLRSATFKRPQWGAAKASMKQWKEEETAKIRAEFRGRDLGAMTLDKVADEMGKTIHRGPPPRFRPWTGDGKVSVQVHAKMPLSTDDILKTPELEDTRIRVSLTRRPNAVAGSKRAEAKLAGVCMFRINSGDKKKPVWTKFEFVCHRPLPPGKQIKWVRLFRCRIGVHFRWEVQFTVSGRDWTRPDTKDASGKVGIDIGWRVMDDGRLRVAVWKGEDGQSGELALDPGWLKAYRKTEHIRSVRDQLFGAAKAELVSWLSRTEVPEWLAKATETIAHWKAPRRLARLVVEWRGKRFVGDADMFGRLEEDRRGREGVPATAWRQRDKHLLLYEANLREQLQANRLDLYRRFAADMRRKYSMAVIEGRSGAETEPQRPMDLRKFHELPADEEPSGALGEKGSRAKEHVRDAACSILRRLLKESMTVVETKPAPDTTRACHACGSVQEWDRMILVHACTECGEEWDQDVNASENLVSGRSRDRSGA